MASLVPCTQCARHVRVGPEGCPFCGASTAALVPRGIDALPSDRSLTRAALVLMGATAILGCGKTAGLAAPAYGGPPPDPAVLDAGVENLAVPAYGAPPIAPPAPSSTSKDRK